MENFEEEMMEEEEEEEMKEEEEEMKEEEESWRRRKRRWTLLFKILEYWSEYMTHRWKISKPSWHVKLDIRLMLRMHIYVSQPVYTHIEHIN